MKLEMKSTWIALFHDESGQDLIEYALVAALIGLAAVTTLKGLSTKIGGIYNDISSGVTNAI